MSKRQQSLARKPRSGQTEAFTLGFFGCCFFFFFNSVLTAHAGRELKENRAPAPCCVCGLQRPARCQAPSCENRIVVCAAESAAAQAFAKSACLALTFTSAFCHRHGENTGLCLCTTWSLACYCRLHLVLMPVFKKKNPYQYPPIAWVDTHLTFLLKNVLQVSKGNLW